MPDGQPLSGLLPMLFGEYGDIASATQPFMTGPMGQSPIFQQQVENFKNLTQPVIQNQFALQGLGGSPALGQAMGVSLGNALVPLMQQDAQNRLAAINLAQQRAGGAGELGLRTEELAQAGPLRAAQAFATGAQPGLQALDLAQQGPLRAAQAYTTGAQPGLQSLGLAGQFGQVAGSQMSDLANQLRQRQELSLSGFGSAGEAQRNVQQQAYDSAYQDYLRRQSLSEASSTGLFGGQVIPSTIGQTSRTKTSSSK